MAIDAVKVAKRLREAGFTGPQSEAVIATVQRVADDRFSVGGGKVRQRHVDG
jgi:hypothetical protein